MRIGFIGTSSTGKTTLSNALSERLMLPHIPEQVKAGVVEANKIWAEAPIGESPKEWKGYDLVKAEVGIIKAQKEAEAVKSLGFVADSAQLQQLMYLMYFCVPQMDEKYAQMLYETVMKHTVRNYDVIFYLPFGSLPIIDDGYRITNKMMLMSQDAILRRLMGDARKRGANIHTVAVTDKDERLTYAQTVAERYERPRTNFDIL